MRWIGKTFSSAFSREQVFTLIVASLALFVSIKSCSISQKAAELTERDFSEQRLITLKGEVDESKDILKISPTEGHLTLLKARAFYPKDFDSTEWPIDSPEFRLYVTMLKFKLGEFVSKSYPSDPQYTQILKDASIPLVIESQYIAKGISYFDKSLYRIEYMAVISGERHKTPQITLKGLLFLGHLDSSEDTEKLLSHLWKSIIENRPVRNEK